MERHQGVLRFALPKNPDGEDADTDDERGDDVSLTPERLLPTGKREGNEEEGDRGNEEESADDVELPEEVDGELLEAELLERGPVSGKSACSGRPVACPDEHEHDEDGRA